MTKNLNLAEAVGGKKIVVETSLSKHQLSLIDECIERIAAMVFEADEFRNAIAQEVVDVKREVFGGEFDISGYQEKFLIQRIAEAIGLTPNALRNWVSVLISVDHRVSQTKDYEDLSFTERLSVVRDIKLNKKKATEAVKDHYADKSNPVKKKIYYLERYISNVLSTARGLEDLSFRPSNHQREMIASFKDRIELAAKIIKGLSEL
jgi:hypothetical protein